MKSVGTIVIPSLVLIFFMPNCCMDECLEEYAAKLEKASRHSVYTDEFLKSSDKLSPEKRLVVHYKFLLENWYH